MKELSNPDLSEVCRYMGCRLSDCDDRLLSEIDACLSRLAEEISPRHIYKKFDIRHRDGGGIEIGNIHTSSTSLYKNLKGCDHCYIMAATLGMGPDYLIRRSQVSRISRSIIFQAAATAMIEDYCDMVNEEIGDAEAAKGMFLRPRFSPGYGDFSIEHQREISDILQLPKTLGINLSESLLMLPSKSVTAIIGVSEIEGFCHEHACESCEKKDCSFRFQKA